MMSSLIQNVNMDLVKHKQALQEELEASHVQLMQLREELSCNADTLTKMKEALQHSKVSLSYGWYIYYNTAVPC